MVCVLFHDKPSGQCLYFTNPGVFPLQPPFTAENRKKTIDKVSGVGVRKPLVR